MICIDMRMPASCIVCPFANLIWDGKHKNSFKCSVAEYRGTRTLAACIVKMAIPGRPQWCPLQEVPDTKGEGDGRTDD